MEWAIILQKIFELCIVPLLGVVTYFIVNYIKAKIAELKTTNSNEVLIKYLDMLSTTIIECVIATNQTYVDNLKGKNAFDEVAQKIAFQKTYEAVLAILSDDAKEYLTHIYGDLSIFITNMIEAEVNRNKG